MSQLLTKLLVAERNLSERKKIAEKQESLKEGSFYLLG